MAVAMAFAAAAARVDLTQSGKPSQKMGTDETDIFFRHRK